MLLVASSPGLKPIESPLATLIFPQSSTYSRGDLGGAGLLVCANAEMAKRAGNTTSRSIGRLVMPQEYHRNPRSSPVEQAFGPIPLRVWRSKSAAGGADGLAICEFIERQGRRQDRLPHRP